MKVMLEMTHTQKTNATLDGAGNLLISEPSVLEALKTKGRDVDAPASKRSDGPIPISINILPA